MKVTIVYDNSAYLEDLKSDWGFSALIEAEGAPKILFDTGADGDILLNNMDRLGIDPVTIQEIFISHHHFDHVGGLSEFLDANPETKIYTPPSFSGIDNEVGPKAITVDKPERLHDNVFSTGELEGIEQSLGVETEKGIVLIVGCSHPKMKNILAAVEGFGKIHGIVGGLHGFSDFELFEDLEFICPTHCTQHKAELNEIYPDKYARGGVGRTIEI